jgi:hypothetical protein
MLLPHAIMASLRDARQYGTIPKPWVETHGYRRNVATRRKLSPQRRYATKTAAVPSLHDENYRRNVAARRKLPSYLTPPNVAAVA